MDENRRSKKVIKEGASNHEIFASLTPQHQQDIQLTQITLKTALETNT